MMFILLAMMFILTYGQFIHLMWQEELDSISDENIISSHLESSNYLQSLHSNIRSRLAHSILSWYTVDAEVQVLM